MNAILEFCDFSFAYSKLGPNASTRVLDGITLALYGGQKIALLGANGAGKSTLLLCANGLHRPESGHILWRSHRLKYDTKSLFELRSKVALVLQNPDEQLFAPTVIEDLSFGPMNLGLPKIEIEERIQKMMAEMEITELAERPIHTLSLGQRKKVALAGALVMNPEVLVLDEPTAGLDPLSEESLLEALHQKSAAGMNLLFSTHDVDLAWRFADQIVLLKNGRILAKGSPHEILTQEDLMKEASLRLPYSLSTPKLYNSTEGQS